MAAWVAFLGEASDVYFIGEILCGLKPIKPHAAFCGSSFISLNTLASGLLDPLLCDRSHTGPGTMRGTEEQHIDLIRRIGTRLVPDPDHRPGRL